MTQGAGHRAQGLTCLGGSAGRPVCRSGSAGRDSGVDFSEALSRIINY